MKYNYYQQDTNLFAGFYETAISASYFLEQDDDYDWESDDFDYKNYENQVATEICQLQFDLIKDDGIITKMELCKLSSPASYNYTTDSLVIDCEFNKKKLLNYCKQHESELDKYIDQKCYYCYYTKFEELDILLDFYLQSKIDLEFLEYQSCEIASNVFYDC